MIKKITIFSLLFFSTFIVHTYAMEERENREDNEDLSHITQNDDQDFVIVITHDKQQMQLSRAQVEQSQALKDLLELTPYNSQGFPEESEEIIEPFDLSLLKTDNNITKEILEYLFDIKNIDDVKNEKIVHDTFQVAQILQMPDTIRHKIIKHLIKINPAIKKNPSFNFERQQYLVSPKNLIQKGIIQKQNGLIQDYSNLKLNSLHGLELLADPTAFKLKLDYNKLNHINIEKILRYFPNLQKLSVTNNKLTKVIMPQWVEKFEIDLSQNPLLDFISPFKAKGLKITTPVTFKNIKKIETYLSRSFFQRYKYLWNKKMLNLAKNFYTRLPIVISIEMINSISSRPVTRNSGKYLLANLITIPLSYFYLTRILATPLHMLVLIPLIQARQELHYNSETFYRKCINGKLNMIVLDETGYQEEEEKEVANIKD